MKWLILLALSGTANAEYFGSAPIESTLSVIMEPAQKVVKKSGPVYNTVRTRANWTYPNVYGQRRKSLIEHLLKASAHRGKFTRARLEALTTFELEKLHSNDHEGRPYRVAGTKSSATDCPT